MTNLNGNIAFVTGASGGIGMAITKKLHSLGAHVFISGSNEKKLIDLGKELKSNYIVAYIFLFRLKVLFFGIAAHSY